MHNVSANLNTLVKHDLNELVRMLDTAMAPDSMCVPPPNNQDVRVIDEKIDEQGKLASVIHVVTYDCGHEGRAAARMRQRDKSRFDLNDEYADQPGGRTSGPARLRVGSLVVAMTQGAPSIVPPEAQADPPHPYTTVTAPHGVCHNSLWAPSSSFVHRWWCT